MPRSLTFGGQHSHCQFARLAVVASINHNLSIVRDGRIFIWWSPSMNPCIIWSWSINDYWCMGDVMTWLVAVVRLLWWPICHICMPLRKGHSLRFTSLSSLHSIIIWIFLPHIYGRVYSCLKMGVSLPQQIYIQIHEPCAIFGDEGAHVQ